MYALLLLLVIQLWSSLVQVRGDAYDDGRWSVVNIEFGEQTRPDLKFAPYHVHVWAPQECSVSCGEFKGVDHPVILFVSAFAGQVSVKTYDTIMRGIAAQGIVVVGLDQKPPGFGGTFDYDDLSEGLENIEKYIQAPESQGFGNSLTADMLAGGCIQKPKVSRFFYAGHSAGSHVVMRRVVNLSKKTESCEKVGGMIFLSPVDGEDPFGFSKNLILPERGATPIVTPAIVIWGTLDPQSSDATKGLSCAPERVGPQHWIKKWRGALFSIQGENYGHLDFLDEGSFTTFNEFCLSKASSVDKAKFRTATKGAIVSFIDGLVNGKTAPLKTLKNEEDLKIKSIYFEKEGDDDSSGAQFSCIFDFVPEPMTYEVEFGIYLGVACFATCFLAGLCTYIRRVDSDNKEDWVIRIEKTPLNNDFPTVVMPIPASTSAPPGLSLRPNSNHVNV